MRKKIGLLFFLLLPVGVAAHPHVFINSNIDFLFSSRRVTAIEVQWRFDPMFTSQVVMSCDANRDRRLTGSEIAAVRRGFFKNLKNHDYFLFIWVNGKYIRKRAVSSFTARIGRDGNLVYVFRIPLPEAGSRLSKIKVMLNDPSLFVAFMSRAGSTRLRGAAPAGVKAVNNAKAQFQLSAGGR